MLKPTVTPVNYDDPTKEQSQAVFDANVDDEYAWRSSAFIELQDVVDYAEYAIDTVAATALAGDLPPLTGKALDFLRVNAGEVAAEFRTPAQVLADIGANNASNLNEGEVALAFLPVGTGAAQLVQRTATGAIPQGEGFGYNWRTARTAADNASSFVETGIPDWATEIIVAVENVDFGSLYLRLGTSAGIVTTGYVGRRGTISAGNVSSGGSTERFDGNTSSVLSGTITFALANSATNTWANSGVLSRDGSSLEFRSGSVALPGSLDRIEVYGTKIMATGSFRVGYR